MYELLDGCCCAGLGGDGYADAGFNVHGFDHEPQPDYPYDFVQADIFKVLWSSLPAMFDALHFSFPCQIHTDARHLRSAQGGKSKYPDLLTPGLEIVRARWNHKPWVIENVDDRTGNVRKIMAPRDGEHLIVLCGSMFGLEVQRHRLFLANFPLHGFPPVPGGGKYRAQGCDHSKFPIDPVSGRPRPWGVYHVKGDSVPDGGRTARDEEHGAEVMGSRRVLPWDKLKEGFPPAYTEFVGRQLRDELDRRQAVAC